MRIGSCLVQLLFGIATFLGEKLLRIKISAEELLFRSRKNEAQHHLYQKKYIFEIANFSENKYFAFSTFSGKLLSREASFSNNNTFYSSYLFRRTTFSQHTFSEELLFDSYVSSPLLQLLFIS